MEKVILTTKRLKLRNMTANDYKPLAKMLQDSEVMHHYSHDYTDQEVWDWLHKQLQRYQEDGFGLWAVCLADTGEMIGQCGVTWQQRGEKQVPEVGYLFQKKYWHQGYALEAAMACRDYAFETLGFDEIYSIIRDTNSPSQKVAVRNGMRQCGSFIKTYMGNEMPHLVFGITRKEWESHREMIKDLTEYQSIEKKTT